MECRNPSSGANSPEEPATGIKMKGRRYAGKRRSCQERCETMRILRVCAKCLPPPGATRLARCLRADRTCNWVSTAGGAVGRILLTVGLVGGGSQLEKHGREAIWLANKEPVVDKALDGGHGTALIGVRGTKNGA